MMIGIIMVIIHHHINILKTNMIIDSHLVCEDEGRHSVDQEVDYDEDGGILDPGVLQHLRHARRVAACAQEYESQIAPYHVSDNSPH